MGKIKVLDCTLRDGAYIVGGNFGDRAIKGIIEKLGNAGIDIIECGWLKNDAHQKGSTYYHLPEDILPYLKKKDATYVAMIDYNRYDVEQLSPYDGKSIDAIRVVFPRGKVGDAIAIGERIRKKGYRVFFQVANTLGYTDEELTEMLEAVNQFEPESISVVDTFGAMYEDDLTRIAEAFDKKLKKDIWLGFHSHNNLQLSFALSMKFVNMFRTTDRNVIVDASLCGMGRGAGNTTTELLTGFLNRKCGMNYDVNEILDMIDIYMEHFMRSYKWGYSVPYFIAGTYCAHVNNIAYLTETHKTSAKAINQILSQVSPEKRVTYDYDNLESIYVKNQSACRLEEAEKIEELYGKKVLLIMPGKSALQQYTEIKRYIERENCIVIGVNAETGADLYNYDFFFFTNLLRHDYAVSNMKENKTVRRIITSNIESCRQEGDIVVDYSGLIKRKWKYFENSALMCMRWLDSLGVCSIGLAGMDGYSDETYDDQFLTENISMEEKTVINKEIQEMLDDFRASTGRNIEFVTQSRFF